MIDGRKINLADYLPERDYLDVGELKGLRLNCGIFLGIGDPGGALTLDGDTKIAISEDDFVGVATPNETLVAGNISKIK